MLVLGCGQSAIRLAPPLGVTRAQAQVALEVFEEAVTVVERGQGGAKGRRARAGAAKGGAARKPAAAKRR